jgi:hypothetical protein
MAARHSGRLKAVFWLPAVIAVLWGVVALADNITPAQEQEFADAKSALEAARKIQAEKYAPEPFKQAELLLQAADTARQAKDAGAYSRTSRLARTYADMAKATAELNAENEKLAATREDLKKVKAEIGHLQKSP